MNSKETRPEISEELVRRACAAYLSARGLEQQEEEELTEEEEWEDIPASPDFFRRTKRLFVRTARPGRTRAWAAMLAAVVLASTVFFSVNVEARDDVMGWFRSNRDKSVVYSFQTPVGQPEPMTVPQTDPARFRPTRLPEGWSEQSTAAAARQMTMVYTDGAGTPQYFTAAAAELGASLLITGAQTPVTVTVGEEYAEFYPAAEEGQYQLLIWQDSRRDILYILSSTASKAQMIKLAESVKEIG